MIIETNIEAILLKQWSNSIEIYPGLQVPKIV